VRGCHPTPLTLFASLEFPCHTDLRWCGRADLRPTCWLLLLLAWVIATGFVLSGVLSGVGVFYNSRKGLTALGCHPRPRTPRHRRARPGGALIGSYPPQPRTPRHRRARPGGALIGSYPPQPRNSRHRRARPGGALIGSYQGLPQGSDGFKLLEPLQTAQVKKCPSPCTRPPTAAEPTN